MCVLESTKMELAHLINSLSNPQAYPYAVGRVEVRQTHLSVVFLAGPYVYKVKKPLRLSFADFGSLELRRHFCEEEVKLNRRLAPSIYLGVVPIVQTDGGLRVEATGSPIEWAVKMERLPDEATLKQRLLRGELDAGLLEKVAGRVAGFHAAAATSDNIAAFGRFEVVAGNARDNLRAAESQVGTAISRQVLDRLTTLTETWLNRLRPLIEQRAERGVPRDTHGDLRLEHVYYFAECEPPSDLAIIDCIEFNERFRFADPVADMAFLVMDLIAHGRRDLGEAFIQEYFRVTGDEEGQAPLPFYVSYRAAVRAKVNGIKAGEPEVPESERAETLARARAHWLHALSELDEPGRRPCLILIAGLPGTGKSTVAQALARFGKFQIIRTDVVRKELAQQSAVDQIYSDEWTERTYAECLQRAESHLFQGERIIVDANFRDESKRRMFLNAAKHWGVPCRIFLCRAEPEVVRSRLASRKGDVSDADWNIYQQLAGTWEAPSDATHGILHELSTDRDVNEIVGEALEVLRSSGL